MSAENADGKPFDQFLITSTGGDVFSVWREEDGSMGVEHPDGHSQKVRSLAEALEPWAELVEALESYRERTKVAA
ncbi:hypothetical protein [Magnetospirillum fulvum]|uniref:Uncharacterized protein n=1 Tax=Magnetospirillum fulvum TaxID=1082 RepID=A0A1H6HWU4_MAGFU|nr:hypothetical protein [Magnetospirillum fulvum]SEH38662.1 hypothetical protein SAMN04244559_02081 [Magnetospirillum fulvum]